MTSHTPDQKRAAIGKDVIQLFAGTPTSLANIKSLAHSMINMPGIASFLTPLPWNMELSDGKQISGSAENLHYAVKDICSQIQHLTQTYHPDTKATLSIDEKRLTPQLSNMIAGA